MVCDGVCVCVCVLFICSARQPQSFEGLSKGQIKKLKKAQRPVNDWASLSTPAGRVLLGKIQHT